MPRSHQPHTQRAADLRAEGESGVRAGGDDGAGEIQAGDGGASEGEKARREDGEEGHIGRVEGRVGDTDQEVGAGRGKRGGKGMVCVEG